MAKGNRAAIYARFSSHNQRDESIEIQVDKSREFCDESGLAVVRVYSDYAKTGKNTNRAEFQAMLKDAQKGLFDYVVIYKVTRIMRNRDEMALARIMLRKAGVEILYAGETLGEGSTKVLHLGMLEVLAEYESAVDSERIRDGIQKNAQRGMASGQRLYGWDVVNDRFVVNEREAAVMHKMKNMLFSGSTIADIQRAIRTERTRRGKAFSQSTIKRLLSREQNCGVYKYAGVRTTNGMPALWSRQEQDEIASILNGRGHKHRVVDGERPYALSGKMYCRECGRWFVGTSGTGKSGKTYYYYRCPKCRRTFRRDLIEDAVSDTILESIHDPKVRERIIATLEMMIAETAEDGAPKESERITAEIRRIDAAFERIWHAIEDGIAPPGGKDRVEELKARQAALKEELEKALEAESAEDLSLDDYLAWLDTLGAQSDPFEIIDTFIRFIQIDGDEVQLYFSFDNWDDDFMPTKKDEPLMNKGSSNFDVVEQKLLTANTIYANSVEIKVTRNWFAIVTFCESNNKNG